MNDFIELSILFFSLCLIGWGVPYLVYLRYKKHKHAWNLFARKHGLTFRPANFLGREAYVVGSYQGYQLRLALNTAFRLRGIISYTYLGLSSDRPFNPDDLSQDQALPGQLLTVDEVTQLLGARHLSVKLKGVIKAEAFGRIIYYEQPGLEFEHEFLTSVANLLHDLMRAYPAIVALGGEVIPSLQAITQAIASNKKRPFQSIALQLLQDIADDTANRLGDQAQQILCRDCLTYYKAHDITLSSWKSLTYYGCRTCGKSRGFFQGRVAAVLDNSSGEVEQEDALLRINWLRRRELFDFHEVQIMQASDEEVERFAVQVGNDTDPLRRARYKQLDCTVWRGCGLSENTIRILQHTFGQVEVMAEASERERLRRQELPEDDIRVRYGDDSDHIDEGETEDVRT